MADAVQPEPQHEIAVAAQDQMQIIDTTMLPPQTNGYAVKERVEPGSAAILEYERPVFQGRSYLTRGDSSVHFFRRPEI